MASGLAFPNVSRATLTDDFDRADGAPGGNWTAADGWTALNISGNELKATSAWRAAAYDWGTAAADFEVSFEVLVAPPTDMVNWYYIVDNSGTNEDGYLFQMQDGWMEIYRVDSGSGTYLTGRGDDPIAAGDIVTLRRYDDWFEVWMTSGVTHTLLLENEDSTHTDQSHFLIYCSGTDQGIDDFNYGEISTDVQRIGWGVVA